MGKDSPARGGEPLRLHCAIGELYVVFTRSVPCARSQLVSTVPDRRSVRESAYGTNMCSIDRNKETLSGEPDAVPPLTLEALAKQICDLTGVIAAATCQWLLMIAEFDEREGWAEWGVRSCAQWLSWRCSIGPRAARDHVRVARRLRELPLVRAAFARGELSYSKARAITRVATEKIEAELLEIAQHATGSQLERLVRGYASALSATSEATQATHDNRYLRWEWDEDGSMRIRGRLSAEDGALLLTALEAAKAPVRRGADPVRQSRADALALVARAALAADGERPSGDPCEIVVHVDADTLGGDEIAQRSELAEGPTLAPETARRLGCDAALVRIVERDGEPLSVGRRTRTISPAMRRALRSRDAGCCFPGCDHRRFLHAHHIQHWARGGRTEIDNLVQLCSHHHRLVHEGGFMVERVDRRRVRFRRPDGALIPDIPRQRGACGPGLAERQRAWGEPVADEACRPRSAGDRIDYGLAVEVLLHRQLRAP